MRSDNGEGEMNGGKEREGGMEGGMEGGVGDGNMHSTSPI